MQHTITYYWPGTSTSPVVYLYEDSEAALKHWVSRVDEVTDFRKEGHIVYGKGDKGHAQIEMQMVVSVTSEQFDQVGTI